jgi:NADH pyrophosphatase NudC (nudix superfamily)
MPNQVFIETVRKHYPEFAFKKSTVARWSPTEHIIFYTNNAADLLHELGHALLGHTDFTQDIELLRIERDAWEKARELAPTYGVEITDDDVEDALDAYRDWLHARSLCPKCGQTGLQQRDTRHYRCLNCGTEWQPNDSRDRQLKRRIIKKRPK